MPRLLWDASALAKHYAPEIGSAVVNTLFSISPALPMTTTYIGYAETCAILRRKRNQGAITASAFMIARSLLDSEAFHYGHFDLMTIDDTAVLAGIALADTHNINSTDAAILTVYLDFSRSLSITDPACVLVASDRRLVRAAAAEGMQTLNPEALLASDVSAIIASL